MSTKNYQDVPQVDMTIKGLDVKRIMNWVIWGNPEGNAYFNSTKNDPDTF